MLCSNEFTNKRLPILSTDTRRLEKMILPSISRITNARELARLCPIFGRINEIFKMREYSQTRIKINILTKRKNANYSYVAGKVHENRYKNALRDLRQRILFYEWVCNFINAK